jgi:hypothetical protein
LDWIDKEFAWTDRHAHRFVEVHARFKTDNLSNLEIDVSALYLIAKPSTPSLLVGKPCAALKTARP